MTDYVRPKSSFLSVSRSSASRPDDAEHRRTLKERRQDAGHPDGLCRGSAQMGPSYGVAARVYLQPLTERVSPGNSF